MYFFVTTKEKLLLLKIAFNNMKQYNMKQNGYSLVTQHQSIFGYKQKNALH